MRFELCLTRRVPHAGVWSCVRKGPKTTHKNIEQQTTTLGSHIVVARRLPTMGRSTFLVLLLCLALTADVVLSRQSPFQASPSSTTTKPRALSGRILHVTDFHPDPHYKVGSAISSGCHSKKPKKEKNRAGYWGSPVSGCDAPTQLVEASMAWIRDNWLPLGKEDHDDQRSPFDFIIWTGDSARHDLDSKYPRTRKEIYDLNKWCLSLLQENFPGTPIVPTIGNNDIFPHNIMWPGPNDVTSAYAEIWADVVPEYQLHTFQLGGYFSLEVIPGKLAVISLNTIYWYDSNKVVDGCKNAKKRRAKRARKERKKRRGGGGKSSVDEEQDDGDAEKDEALYEWQEESLLGTSPSSPHAMLKSRDPGTIQLEWLEAQLDQYRKRGVHVHLIGHVPPTAGNYFDECYDVYTDIVLHNQETVIAQHFGHMNVDAFFVQEDTEAVRREDKKRKSSKSRDDDDDDDVVQSAALLVKPQSFSDDLRKDYALLPGQGRTNLSYYHYFFEAPSIVPTYLPSIRVWTYNVSGIEVDERVRGGGAADDADDDAADDFELFAAKVAESKHSDAGSAVVSLSPTTSSFETLRRKHRRPKHRHRNNARVPRHVSPTSPARTNTGLSLLGYSQWTLNLDEANKQVRRVAVGREDGGGGVDASTFKPPKPASKLDFGLEYATYSSETLWGDLITGDEPKAAVSPSPVPRHLLERELSRRKLTPGDLIGEEKHSLKLPKELKHLTEYGLPHITIDEMLRLARKLAVDDKLWKRYEKRVYQESGAD